MKKMQEGRKDNKENEVRKEEAQYYHEDPFPRVRNMTSMIE